MVFIFSFVFSQAARNSKSPSFRLIPTSEDNETPLQQLQVAISTQQIHRIRRGSVCFHFSYDGKLHMTQVAQDFSCPFCSISCLHLEGLKCHFSACHDEFIFEYSVTDDVPDVYVSVNFDQKKSESICVKILIVCNQCLRAALHLLQGFKTKIGGHQLNALIRRSKITASVFFSNLDEGYKLITF
nr:polycomb group protein EMBRYONIC FLOWER 2-like isoform X1 [Ipomoea batatas]